MMTARAILVSSVLVSLAPWAGADTNIVNESFDSYADTAAMQVAWPGANGALTTDDTTYPDLAGKGAFHPGGTVSEFGGMPAQLLTSDSQTIVLGGDIFDDGLGNSRMTIGMRAGAVGENLLEMGYWNTDLLLHYAYRLSIWFGTGDTGWSFPVLNPDFDVNGDSAVGPADIANYAFNNEGHEMWHRWEAAITPDTVTITMDLFRDGLTNDPLVPENSVPGVDFTVVHTDITATGAGFGSLRFGGASGLSSLSDGIYDNIALDLIDVDADFDDDGDVDGDDFLILQRGNGLTGQTDNSNGDADATSIIDGGDVAAWQRQFGTNAVTAVARSVPEPSTTALMLLVGAGLALFAGRAR